MFNQKTLPSTQQNTSLQQRLQQRAENCFQSGLQALQMAHGQGFQDPLTVRRACEALIETIRLQREDLRPYLMLSYLFAIHEDFGMAWQYLLAAEQLQPADPDVLQFRRQLQRRQAGNDQPETEAEPVAPVAEAGVEPGVESDQDQAYLALELRLRNRIQALQRQVPAVVTANPSVLAELEEECQRFHEQQQRLAVRIEALAASHDTVGLYKWLEQLDQLWEPYEWALRQSRALTAFKHKIQQTQLQVLTLLRQSVAARSLAQIQQLERELEILLDQCDHFTHIQEALLRRQVPIDEVEPVYRNLLGQVDLFRETLDECLATMPDDL
ncbi:MAG: hypothetical protein CVV27_19955 [Candidatus Melainabacteria bacterium HGW-Melainabacteria-1]|nr:MAG: hypothetical protein CVV27_19955 [Candidatus Melainabacteria bacterium HGW-Melainabacteria-1]